MKVFSYIIILFVLVLGVSFSVLNADVVTINYYIGTQKLPLSLLLVLAFGVGLVLGLLVMSFVTIRLKVKVRRYRKKLKLAEKEIDNLRVIPVRDEH